MKLTGSVLLCNAALVSGHGAMVSPRSRNSIDYLVGVNTPKDWPYDAGCVNITGDKCENGQAAFYYSQGCFIGCSECDHMSGRRQTDLCGNGMKPTLPNEFRSVNLDAEPGSDLDIYKHNPWRAPGNAPVASACGLAGGTPWLSEVGEAGDYTNGTILPNGEPTHHGLDGVELPPMDTGVKWTIGSEAEITWQVENNHGGGYSYRLCPADQNLTEACFQSHQLDFVTDNTAVVYPNGTTLSIKGVFVTEGTFPKGSMWARIPFPTTALGPRCLPGPNDTASTPNGCHLPSEEHVDGPCLPCPQTPGSDCSRCDNHWGNNKTSFPPPCDECDGSTHTHAIRDMVKVPSDLPPGKYVLGWRWDCEATAQVWNSCADVTLVV
jgi:hypothetical protein